MCTFHELFCHLHARHWVGWDLRRKSNYKNKFVFVPQPRSVNQHCSLGLNDVRQLAAEESMSLRNSTFTNLNQSEKFHFVFCDDTDKPWRVTALLPSLFKREQQQTVLIREEFWLSEGSAVPWRVWTQMELHVSRTIDSSLATERNSPVSSDSLKLLEMLFNLNTMGGKGHFKYCPNEWRERKKLLDARTVNSSCTSSFERYAVIPLGQGRLARVLCLFST